MTKDIPAPLFFFGRTKDNDLQWITAQIAALPAAMQVEIANEYSQLYQRRGRLAVNAWLKELMADYGGEVPLIQCSNRDYIEQILLSSLPAKLRDKAAVAFRDVASSKGAPAAAAMLAAAVRKYGTEVSA